MALVARMKLPSTMAAPRIEPQVQMLGGQELRAQALYPQGWGKELSALRLILKRQYLFQVTRLTAYSQIGELKANNEESNCLTTS